MDKAHSISSHRWPTVLLAVLLLVAVGAAFYLFFSWRTSELAIEELNRHNQALQTDVASTTNALASASSTIAMLTEQLEELEEELDDTKDDLRDERNRNEEFQDQINELAGTVGDLDKLARTDEELLAKYSKVYFLNENYRPERLSKLDDDLVTEGRSEQYFLTSALPFLEEMLEEAEDDGVDLRIASAFRSFEEQSQLKGQYTIQYGTGANAFSADQGYSEHQLGTAIDFTTPGATSLTTAFGATEAFEWLQDNAHKYGFILSYPQGNQFYVYEPWHWRFVGEDLAEYIHDEGTSFYEMDQREINEYLVTLFD